MSKNLPKEHKRHNKKLDKKICRDIAAGKLLVDICDEIKGLEIYTVQRWINERKDFRTMFIPAVAHGMRVLSEEAIKNSDLILNALDNNAGATELSALKVYVAAKNKAIDNYCKVMTKVLGFFINYDNMVDEQGKKIENNTDKKEKEVDLKKLLDIK